MTAGVEAFTAAYQTWDQAGFAKASDLFEQAGQQAPGSGSPFYWKGVAEFHRMLHLLGAAETRTNRPDVTKAMNATIAALKLAVKRNAHDAESQALLGTVYGMSIAASPTRALWLGPRVMGLRDKGLRDGPENPRVQYLIGMSHYHAPDLLGGKEEALKCLLKAEKLYALEAGKAAGPLEPRWGRSSCLAFIGKTYDALGKPAEADQYFRKALKLNPQDRLAREELEKRQK